MAGPLDAYRQRYPRYRDVDDETLGRALYDKAYRDRMSWEDFRRQVGLPSTKKRRRKRVIERVEETWRKEDAKPANQLNPARRPKAGMLTAPPPPRRSRRRRNRPEGQLSAAPSVGVDEFVGPPSPDQYVPGEFQGPPAPPEEPGFFENLTNQFMSGWRSYQAARSTQRAARAGRDIVGAEQTAAGLGGLDPSGAAAIPGVTAGDLSIERDRLDRAAAAEAGDPEAQAAIDRDVAFLRRSAAGRLQAAIAKRQEALAKAAGIQPSEVTSRMMAAETASEAVDAFFEDPITIAMEVTAQSLPNMADAIVLGTAGALLGPAGGAIGLGAGSAAAEYRASFADALVDEGVDLSSADAVLEAVENPELMQRVIAKAGTRGAIIGSLDALSGGIASKTLTPFVRSAVGRAIANQTAQGVVQAGLGAAGEAGAQLATEGELAPGEILAEAVGEGPSAVVETGVATVAARISPQGARAEAARVQREVNDMLAPIEVQDADIVDVAEILEDADILEAETIAPPLPSMGMEVVAEGPGLTVQEVPIEALEQSLGLEAVKGEGATEVEVAAQAGQPLPAPEIEVEWTAPRERRLATRSPGRLAAMVVRARERNLDTVPVSVGRPNEARAVLDMLGAQVPAELAAAPVGQMTRTDMEAEVEGSAVHLPSVAPEDRASVLTGLRLLRASVGRVTPSDTSTYLTVQPGKDIRRVKIPDVPNTMEALEVGPFVELEVPVAQLRTRRVNLDDLSRYLQYESLPKAIPNEDGTFLVEEGAELAALASAVGMETVTVRALAAGGALQRLPASTYPMVASGLEGFGAQPVLQRMIVESMPATAEVNVAELANVARTLGLDAQVALVEATRQALRQEGVAVYRHADGHFTIGADTQADLNAQLELARALVQQYEVRTATESATGFDLLREGQEVDQSTLRVTPRESPALIEDLLRWQVGPRGGLYRWATGPDGRERKIYRRRVGTPPPEDDGRRRGPTQSMTLQEARSRPSGPGSNYVPPVGLTGSLPVTPQGDYVLGNGRRVNRPGRVIRREHILALVQRTFGARIYQGNMRGPRSRLGFYRRRHGEIRIRTTNDVEVVAHELAHWLDENQSWISELYNQQGFRAELESVSYDVSSVEEGFAEFMRHFLTQEHEAIRGAPGFYDAFRRTLEQDHPELAAMIYDVQELSHAWMLQGAENRLRSKHETRSGPSVAERIRRALAADWRQKGLDGLRAAREVELDVTNGESMTAYHQLRLGVGGANSTIEAAFLYGTPGWRADGTGLEYTGESLRDVFGDDFGSPDLALYLIARRAQELQGQGRENLIREDEIAAGLALEAVNPRFREIHDRYQRFNDRILDFAEDSGILSPTSREAIQEANQSYIPFYRVMESMVDGRPVRNAGTPFRRLRGGTQNLANVWDSMVNNMSMVVRQSLLNRAKQTLYGSIFDSRNQRGALYAAPIPAATRTTRVRTEAVIRRLVESMGMSWSQYQAASQGMPRNQEEAAAVQVINRMRDGASELMEIFTAGSAPTGTVDSYKEGGTTRYVEIGDAALWDTIQFLGPKPTGPILAMFAFFSNLLRRGVTALPVFQFKNLMRDSVYAYVTSGNVVAPMAGAIKAMGTRLHTNERYREMVLNGGSFANRVQGLAAESRVVYDPRSLGARYDRFMTRFENANRLAEWNAARDAGVPPREAAIAAREISTDFAMRGSSETMRFLAVAIPFLNARLQGLYNLARASSDRGRLQSMAIRGGALALASVALYLTNKDDERYDEMPEDVRDLYWVIFTGEGEDDYVLIPKPFEVGLLFATTPERLTELAIEQNGKEFAEAMRWQLWEVFQMDMTPQVFAPALELYANEGFRGPIIPLYLEGVEPSEQFTHYTSASARVFGKATGLSPIATDHVVRGYLGTLGAYALGASDALIRATTDIDPTGDMPTRGETWRENILVRALADPLVREGPLPRTKYTNDFYELAREVEVTAKTVAMMKRQRAYALESYLARPDVQRNIALNTVVSELRPTLTSIRTATDAIRMSPQLSGDEKRQQIWALTRQRNQVVRELMRAIQPMLRDGSIPVPEVYPPVPPEEPGQTPKPHNFGGQRVFEPGSPSQVALFREAARRAEVPEAWAEDPGLIEILKRESRGMVGAVNYTYGDRSRDPEQWTAVHEELKAGRRSARSSATGLGQLLLPNVDRYYPSGRAGIGDPMEEAVGMLRYIRSRYGTPKRAWRMYGKVHEGY